MENNYNLKIQTTQVVESEAFNMDFEMNASYVKINETRYISYIQVDEDTKNKLRTTIKIKPDGVVTIIKGKSEGMIPRNRKNSLLALSNSIWQYIA